MRGTASAAPRVIDTMKFIRRFTFAITLLAVAATTQAADVPAPARLAVCLDADDAPDPCVDADEHAASRRTGPITA